MTETLTGRAALIAILEGTHWWFCAYRDGTFIGAFAFLNGRLARKRTTLEAEALGGPLQYIDEQNAKMLESSDLQWTRAHPV